MPAIHLTSESFDKVIQSGQVVLVDFWASWCRPCQMMGPILDQLADDFKDRAIIAKLNTDDCKEICSRYGITSIPTFKLFKNGVELDNAVGAVPKETLQNLVEKHL
jgi:thioredoxin 1